MAVLQGKRPSSVAQGRRRRAQPATNRKSRKPRPGPIGPFSLIERKLEGRKFAEFPHMKGKKLEKLEFFTTPEYHSFTLDFADNTSLTLKIEPCFILQASFFDLIRGNQEIREEWLPIQSATDSN